MQKAESGNHQASVTSVTLGSTFIKSILSDFCIGSLHSAAS